MKPNEEIMEFLKENPTFYLATVDGYLPRVRPIGFAMSLPDVNLVLKGLNGRLLPFGWLKMLLRLPRLTVLAIRAKF